MRYTVVLLRDEQTDTYTALVPALPGCITQGGSVEDAVAMALDAASAMLEDMADQNEEIPAEVDGTIVTTIEVKAPVSTEVAA